MSADGVRIDERITPGGVNRCGMYRLLNVPSIIYCLVKCSIGYMYLLFVFSNVTTVRT